jgi:hypothetical protein
MSHYPPQNEKDNKKFWLAKANKHLKGKIIREVRYLEGDSLPNEDWNDSNHRALQIIFTDGHWITPSIDPAGNGPGCLFTTFDDHAEVLL